MKKIFLTSLSLIAVFFSIISCNPKQNVEQEEESIVDERIFEYGIPVSEYNRKEAKIKKNEFFANLLSDYGVSDKDIYQLSLLSKDVFDLRQIRVGNKYEAYFTTDELPSLAYLVYEKDSKSHIVFSTGDSLWVKQYDKEIQTVTKYAEVVINRSLWEDVVDAGIAPELALQLSDIYAWTIDFFGLQKGDSFKALFEENVYKNEVIGIEKILYSVFSSGDKSYEAYYFEEEEKGNKYWNEKGESMRKAFLKAPLTYFSRISSRFTYARRHPITRIVRPHTGVDYAAPTGTPVLSIGDGTVIQKTYDRKGGGNMVKIRHNSVYTTAYLHLSRYGKGIAVGKRVHQGEVIGYVGSTGSSTGPHLDFRVWRNGSPINPLTMESPPSHPIAKENLEKFEAQKERTLRKVKNYHTNEYLMEMVDILSK